MQRLAEQQSTVGPRRAAGIVESTQSARRTRPDDRLPTTSLLFTTDLQRPPRKMLSLKMSRDLVSLNLNAGGKPWCAVFLVF